MNSSEAQDRTVTPAVPTRAVRSHREPSRHTRQFGRVALEGELSGLGGGDPGTIKIVGLRVALFTTCLVDGLFPDVGKATVRLLRRLGQDVAVPRRQTCCGQMHVNTGYQRDALPLIKNHVAAFAGYDAVVAPSGSCAAAIRHQHSDVAEQFGRNSLAASAREVAAHTYELSEFLVDVLGVTDVGACYPHRVTYHPTCHSLRLLRVGDRPYRLLREVSGLDLVPRPSPAADSAEPSR